MRRQLEVSGILALEGYFKLLQDNVSAMSLGEDPERECSQALKVIADVVRLPWASVEWKGLKVNRRDLAFQMYSQLFSLIREMEWVKHFRETIKKSPEKPWAKVVR